MENMNQHHEERELSAEELTTKKAEMLKFYEDSIPYLDAQLNYEKKLAEIDEVRFKRTSIQMQLAMMMNPQDGEDLDDEPEVETAETPKERKLKKQ
jgi:hypothetical protein